MVWHPDRFPADSPLRAKAEERLKENGRRTGDEMDFSDTRQINFAWPVALYIGVPTPNNHPNRGRYDGLMDDLRIYSRALTSEEVRQLAGLPESPR